MKNINTIDSNQRSQSGFTLIELMVVMSMIVILSAVAIPSYKKYIRHNAESIAVARVKSLELELDRWRASTLTYRGFIPVKSTIGADGEATLSHAYDNADNKTIYVPEGSTSTDYLYKITLDDGSGGTLNPATAPTSTEIATSPTGVVGNTWRMIIVPNSTKSSLKRAEKYLITNRGVACKTSLASVNFDTTVDAKTNCAQNGVDKW